MNVPHRFTSRVSLAELIPTILLAILLTAGCQPAMPPTSPAPAAAVHSTSSALATATTETPTEVPVADGAQIKSGQPAAVRVKVAAASDLRFVMADLQLAFEKQSPGITVEATFGASGSLFAQVSNRAPFDVFLSADIQYPQKLAEQRLIKPGSLFRYAVGHIVLWVRKESPLDVERAGAAILQDPQLKKVAIANPKLAPYGRAAAAALKNLGLYEGLQEKLVLGETVAQTAQFAETGAADAAVIGKALAVAPQFADKGKFWPFPEDSYPSIEQAGVVLEQATDVAASQKFCDFLKSPAAGQIFLKFGFELPEVPTGGSP